MADILHKARNLFPGVTGDVMIVDTGEIEEGDLIFLAGCLIVRALTRPRDRLVPDGGERRYKYDNEYVDSYGLRQRGWFMLDVGQPRLILRPTS